MTRDDLMAALLLRIERTSELLAADADESGAQLTYARRCELCLAMACDAAQVRALATPMTWPADAGSL